MIRALIGVDEPVLQSGLGQLVVDELLYQRGRPPRSAIYSSTRSFRTRRISRC
jgi:hypothetical protein